MPLLAHRNPVVSWSSVILIYSHWSLQNEESGILSVQQTKWHLGRRSILDPNQKGAALQVWVSSHHLFDFPRHAWLPYKPRKSLNMLKKQVTGRAHEPMHTPKYLFEFGSKMKHIPNLFLIHFSFPKHSQSWLVSKNKAMVWRPLTNCRPLQDGGPPNLADSPKKFSRPSINLVQSSIL